MARRLAKKGKIKNQNSAVENIPSPSGNQKKNQGVPFVVLLLIIVAILAYLYGPGLFKGMIQGGPKEEAATGGFQPGTKIFTVKKLLQFTGDQTQGKPFFANDIVPLGSGEFAISDNLGGQVLVFDLKGKLVRKWGKNGHDPKDFSEPSGVAVDQKGHLLVLDTMNNAIKTFDSKGKLLNSLELGHFGVFSTPRRIGWGGNSMLLTNAADARLYRISSGGELLGAWGEKGEGKGGHLWAASKPIADAKGRFYVGDFKNKDSLVRVYDATGKVVQEFKTGLPADALALDSKNRLYVGCYGEPAKVFDSNGDWLGFLADVDQPSAPLNLIAGIAILPNDLILTCGENTVTIYQLSSEKEKS